MRRRIEATTSDRSFMLSCITFAAEVEEAVTQPRLFRVLLIAEDDQRQFFSGPQNFHDRG